MTEERVIVLASASPRRRELLGQIGIVPEIIPSTLEEKITTDRPEDVVKELSLQKAADVAKRCAKDIYRENRCACVSHDRGGDPCVRLFRGAHGQGRGLRNSGKIRFLHQRD